MFDSPPVPATSVATAAVLVPLKREKLLAIATWFDGHATDQFGPLHNVERMTPQQLADTPTKGTLFAAFNGALWEGGIKAPDMETMDPLMSYLELSQDEVNKIGCYCVHQTGSALGSHVKQILQSVAGV